MTHRQNRFNALVIEDDSDMGGVICDLIQQLRSSAKLVCNWEDAHAVLGKETFDVVFSDIHMPGMTGLDFLELWKKKTSSKCHWVFISGDGTPETIERAMKAGAIDVMQKPVRRTDIEGVLERLFRASENPLVSIMHSVQSISGVRLGEDKRLLVETRIMRRARALGMSSVSQYVDYFSKNSQMEVPELISILTTHTTSFFREIEHFHYLEKEMLGKLTRGDSIRIWSAACSTGEEVYTLAICVLESLRKRGLENKVRIEVMGSDIDFNAVSVAEEGVFPYETVSKMAPDLIKRYFDQAQLGGQLWVRVGEDVHKLCRFRQQNLLSSHYKIEGKFDAIFLRNVLIYFGTREIEHVVKQLKFHLKPEGKLFLGHSESIASLNTGFSLIGNSIYRMGEAQDKIDGPLKMVIPLHKGGTHSQEETRTAKSQKLRRVLIVDDSAVVRKMLRAILSPEHDFEVVGEANHPIEADVILQNRLDVDVITLDIHMPEMDGITYLRKLGERPQRPAVVMVSSVSREDATNALHCFELGAFDYIEKPQAANLMVEGDRIRAVVGAAAKQKNKTGRVQKWDNVPISSVNSVGHSIFDLLMVGSSTGGVEALRIVLGAMPETTPPILIVQHIPGHFSAALARRLDDCCKITVKEAEDGERVQPNTAYIAPGGRHMKVEPGSGNTLHLRITDDPALNHHRPSVDYMFSSALDLPKGLRMAAAILTGMGSDGAQQLKRLRDAGHYTIAQDEESSVIYGMPKVAAELGGAAAILPLTSIAYHLLRGGAAKARA